MSALWACSPVIFYADNSTAMKQVFLLACLLLALAAAAQTPDPGTPGPFTVARDTFDLGNLAYKPDSFGTSVEVRGLVYYPASLSGGPFPVIFLMHGRHSTTYNTANPSLIGGSWPPATGYQSIVSFEGYNYFAELMASHGYIVVSISTNAINARDNARSDLGMNARAQLLQYHMDLWKTYNTTGAAPFGSKFVGKLDMQRMGTMGHSRGGEGVIFHALLNRSLGSPYGIKAVLSLAPIDNGRKVLNNIPLMNIAPYCDGDVTSLSGVHFYDDARYNVPGDTAPKHSVLMMGANHNFYNTVWTPGSYIAGTSDDGDGYYGTTKDPYCSSKRSGTGRLDTTTQRAAFAAYAAAFFRRYVGGDTTFAPLLEVADRTTPVSAKIPSDKIFVSWHPGVAKRKDLNRIYALSEDVTNTLGGPVTKSALTTYSLCGGGSYPSCGISTGGSQEPHSVPFSAPGMGQLSLRWSTTSDYYSNAVPAAHQNVSGFAALSFRAAVNYKFAAAKTDFSIQLIDSFGRSARVPASAYTSALFFPPGSTTGALPKILHNTIRIPLDSFPGVNLTKLAQVRFVFDSVSAGAVLIADLAFVGQAAPCRNIAAAFADTIGGGYFVRFGDKSFVNKGDTVRRLWNFGNPASGKSDTSTAAAPLHVFTGPGNYKVCLYLEVRRSNGVVCRDTLCRNLTLTPNSISESVSDSLLMYPNPVVEQIWLISPVLLQRVEIRDLSGRLCLQQFCTAAAVSLSLHDLPAGMYLLRVQSADGRYFAPQKLLKQ